MRNNLLYVISVVFILVYILPNSYSNTIYATNQESNDDNIKRTDNNINSDFNFNSWIKEGVTDKTGTYDNPKFDIEQLTIPKGWYGNEITINNSLIFTMSQEKQSDLINNILNSNENQSDVTFTLGVHDIKDLDKYSADAKSVLNSLNLTEKFTPRCNPTEKNSTITVNNKVFKTYANECTMNIPNLGSMFSINNSEMSNSEHSFSITELKSIYKTYEYKTPTNVISFVVTIDDPDKMDNNNKAKYFELAETIIKTLKVS